ncbi:MAG TPA: MlaD family protein [Verrucomicrobiae bacterium]|nr:MlaD family protein [Verrucomicrobiae bacterium]
MALQDLTPQLRTRLSRMERAVGWFVIIATALLVFGFGYYIYNIAARKGWFTPKFQYQTGLNNAAGLKEGNSVMLMGKSVGEITRIVPNAPDDYYGMTVYFQVLKPDYGYIWDDSRVKVSSDFLGNRFLEITKGASGVPTIDENTNRVAVAMLRSDLIRSARAEKAVQLRSANPDMARTNAAGFEWLVGYELKQVVAANRARFYTNLESVYWLDPDESPALNERLEAVANQVEEALPNILNLTNQLAAVLSNSAVLMSHLSDVAVAARPAVSNLALITANLDKPGSLGEWLLPTNINQQLDSVLGEAGSTLNSANTNVAMLAHSLNETLISLAGITSNLNTQVQQNTNIVSQISKAIVDADNLVQGLKRHWLLRSAFKEENAEGREEEEREKGSRRPILSPRDAAR